MLRLVGFGVRVRVRVRNADWGKGIIYHHTKFCRNWSIDILLYLIKFLARDAAMLVRSSES